MPLLISKKDFDKIKDKKKDKKAIEIVNKEDILNIKKTRTSIDRLKDATNILRTRPNVDKLYLSTDTMILEFIDIALVSNNDLLRIDNREIYSFKSAWHERVLDLLKGVDLSQWKTKENPVVIEFLY